MSIALNVYLKKKKGCWECSAVAEHAFFMCKTLGSSRKRGKSRRKRRRRSSSKKQPSSSRK
jgi:hypothetical protein